MKSRILFFLLLPLLGSAQGKLTITGKIKGLQEGSSVSLVDVNRSTDTFATAVVTKEAFVLKTTLKEPALASLQLGNQKAVMTFLDNSKVKVTGDIAELQKIKVTGSPTNEDFKEFQKRFNPLFERLGRLNEQMRATGPTDSLVAVSTVLQDTIQRAIDLFITKHRSSAISAFLIAATMQLKEDVLLTEQRLAQLKPAALSNVYGTYLQQIVAETKITAIGSTAIDFTQADTLGNPVSLSSFRGKYVLVDFWASWCGPCRQENPNVVSNYTRFKQKNFTVLGVSLDRPGQKDKWIQAIHTDGLDWTHVSDLQFWNNAVARQYNIQSIPQNLLIGPDGRIVAKNLRGPALEAKLCEVLGCN